MAFTSVRRLGPFVAVALVALALQIPVHAATPGTWTKITTPSGRTTILSNQNPGQMTVAGHASPDVAVVNVYCLRGIGAQAASVTVATAVPVTSGAFQATVPVPSISGFGSICRLRALPNGVGIHEAYVASYAGPVVNFDQWGRSTDAGRVFSFFLQAGSGNGEITATGGGNCASRQMNTVEADLTADHGSNDCMLGLGDSNLAGTSSGLVVDGHQAYLPYGEFQNSLTSVRELSVSVHARANGRLTWKETATIERCAGTDQFPPPNSCTSMIPAGVEFRRVGTLLPNGHQVRIRDSFTSTDGKRHHLALAYQMGAEPPVAGALGYDFPKQGGGFVAPTAGAVVNKLGTKAGTLLIRSDRFSAEGDPQADTRALTWSRAPGHVKISSTDVSEFEMTYALTVPKNGAAHVGFADSEAITTAAASALASRGVADMMPNPRITSPADHAVIKGRSTTVKGKVRAGANGLPVSVTVNGHAATLTPTSATTAKFKVTFKESLGKHTLTAVAKDAAGNTRRASIRVRNTA
jgi:hypothetical protein